MSDRCPDCGKPEWDGGHAPNDARECYRRGDVVCSLTAKLRASEAEVARLRREVEDVRFLDARAAHRGENVPQVQRDLRDKSGARQWTIYVSDDLGGRMPFTGTSASDARRAAVGGLTKSLPRLDDCDDGPGDSQDRNRKP